MNAILSTDELRKRAEDLVPLIESKARSAEQNREMDGAVVEALAETGLFALRKPQRFGGHEVNARDMGEILSTLSAADASTGWNTAVWAIGDWLVSAFPDHVQEQVFAEPTTRVCVSLSPTALATETEDGLVINGRWHFVSGARNSQWQAVMAMAPAPDGNQWPVAALVPMSELGIDDDWHTSGFAGTGSVSTVAENVVVPRDRVLPMVAVLQDQYASELNAGTAIFRAPMIPTGAAGFIGVAIGMGRAALAEFRKNLPGKQITFTDYGVQAEAPVTHFEVAEAALKLEEAEYYARTMATILDDKGAAGEAWSLEERMHNRGRLGRLVRLVEEAVDVLASASGGSSIKLSTPIQRIRRDMQAFALHGLMHPNTNYELYGRSLCGLGPNSHYI
jgi:alkylation response protein AidB-like acyl-CoA dehydrogenase